MGELTPNDPKHGTLNGYRTYRCRCGSCKEANRQYCEKYRKKRQGTLDADDPRHGLNGYKNYSCRCSVCTQANKLACVEYNKVYSRGEKTLTPEDSRHGTLNGYRTYRCRCDLCKKAESINSARKYKKRKQKRQ